jgi:hypothetical protein
VDFAIGLGLYDVLPRKLLLICLRISLLVGYVWPACSQGKMLLPVNRASLAHGSLTLASPLTK